MNLKTWIPTLDESLARAAREALFEIARSLPAPGDEHTIASLGNGEAGFALFHAYLAESGLLNSQRAEQHRELMLAHLQAAVSKLGDLGGRFDLFSGFMGISWAANHLHSLNWLDDIDDLCDVSDRAALDVLNEQGDEMLCELVSGLSGIGLYGLARRHRPLGAEIVQRARRALEVTAVCADGRRTWFHAPERMSAISVNSHPEGCFNLGLSHGVPGALVFLSRAGASELAAEATEWLLLQRRNFRNGSRFGYTFTDDPMREPDGARLAWCYGDLSVSVALLSTARHAGRLDWEAEAIDLALNAAKRPMESSGVVDAGFCHGAIGNAHIFMKLHAATGEPTLLEAAHRWLGEGLKMRVPGQGRAGFMAYCPLLPNEPERALWQPSASLIDGTCGIGLMLIGMLALMQPAWDEVFMLDIPAKVQ
ncbi:lanthionine synthetase C family protein [Steroidobacter flavus]|uniref:Lanthionine synthetase C family protein n=1 Tax=Steroidobacter flavus TaxID=1842136 RepID=A0ABV8SRM4_9GAMM